MISNLTQYALLWMLSFTLLATTACNNENSKTSTPATRHSKQQSISSTANSNNSPSSDSQEPAVQKPRPSAPQSDMLRVPGGTFTMGLDHPRAIPDERAAHDVYVETFDLDKTEVTNAAYNECVKAGVCSHPKEIDTTRSGFEVLRKFRQDTHPVSGVSRVDAMTYCKWKKKRLPTEAEFERAARGDDNRMYTWGNDPPTPSKAVYASKVTQPVGSKPAGAGPYGHLDLSGNVWEWTADIYDPLAYTREGADHGIPANCPTIKTTQDQLRKDGKQGFTGTNPIPTDCDHVLRGGAFNYFAWGLRASNRVHHPETWKMIMAGFRCAKDVE